MPTKWTQKCFLKVTSKNTSHEEKTGKELETCNKNDGNFQRSTRNKIGKEILKNLASLKSRRSKRFTKS